MHLTSFKYYLLDMDGTVYLGERLIPGSLQFLKTLEKQGKKYYFLTNNSSFNSRTYVKKLHRLGLTEASNKQVITSGEATAWHLASNGEKRVYLLGTPELELDFLRAGHVLVSESPNVVVLGYDKTLHWGRLEQACKFIRQGIPFYATHPDINCPSEEGPLIDAGSLIKAIEVSTGVSPVVIGKPHVSMVEYALHRCGGTREKTVMIGDRLYTDIAMGNQSGITTILVLSGETIMEDLNDSPYSPDYVFPSLAEIAKKLSD